MAITTGRYDVLAWVNLEDAQALAVFLRERIGAVTGVRQTETFIVLDSRKHGPGRPAVSSKDESATDRSRPRAARRPRSQAS